MTFQNYNRKRKSLCLPSRLAAELGALGHTVEPSHVRNSSERQKSHKQVKSNQQLPKRKPSSTDDIAYHSSKSSTKLSNKLTSEKKSKKTKLDHHEQNPPSSSTSKPKSKTALEKLLKKQQFSKKSLNENKAKLKSKSKDDELEDRQIAWLEAQLGLKSDQESKLKLRKEFEEDGLEDLFDGLDELDQIVDSLATRPHVNEHIQVAQNSSESSESECQDCAEDNDSDNFQSDSTWLGAGDDVRDELELLDTPNIISEKSTSNSNSYIPPHLRSKEVQSTQNHEAPIEKLDNSTMDPRLRRQMMGILNRISPTSVPACLESVRDLYLSHPRATINHGLGGLILTLISSNETISNTLLITYATLVSAIARGGVQVSGVEIGWTATFVADLATRICMLYEVRNPDLNKANENGKKGNNLLGFLSHLYFFQEVSHTLLYDIARMLIEQGLNEDNVECLIVLLKASGTQLRHDSPAAFKDMILLVQAHRKNLTDPSSRIKFMLDTLSDLKNNKTRKEPQSISGTIEELQQNLKKYLTGLSKKSGLHPEPIQFKLKDLKEAHKKGKWWLIGAAWKGDPLVDANIQLQHETTNDAHDDVMINLARRQGMNTDVRRSIFNAIMTAEDYIDACEKVNLLGLKSIQQREIIRVLLHCLTKEKIYNPYYTMIGQKLASESRSIQITFQFLLWDFFRELGEKDVGGHEMIKNLNLSLHEDSDDHDTRPTDVVGVDMKKMNHIAWAYAWWIAKGSLSINVLKPLPFGSLKQKTEEFLTKLISLILISIQSTSPVLAVSSSTRSKVTVNDSSSKTKLDETSIANVFKKILVNLTLTRSLVSFLEDDPTQSGRGGFHFHLKNMIDPSCFLPHSSDHNNHLVQFFGCMISKYQVVHFLNLINRSKTFLVEFLSLQL